MIKYINTCFKTNFLNVHFINFDGFIIQVFLRIQKKEKKRKYVGLINLNLNTLIFEKINLNDFCD